MTTINRNTFLTVKPTTIKQTNPLDYKIVFPYVCAIYSLAVDRGNLFQITRDFKNLKFFLEETFELEEFIHNPTVTVEVKKYVITRLLKPRLCKETFAFLMVLSDHKRITLMTSAVYRYMRIIYNAARIKQIDISTSYPFTGRQQNRLVRKIRKLTNAKGVVPTFVLEPNLIGGFLLITNDLTRVDFTIKTQLQKLANHLASVLVI
jgi:F-type H+-transporting ATPase subunit delta